MVTPKQIDRLVKAHARAMNAAIIWERAAALHHNTEIKSERAMNAENVFYAIVTEIRCEFAK